MKFCFALIGTLSVLGSTQVRAADIDLDKVPEVAITTENIPFYVKAYAGVSMADINKVDKFDSGDASGNYHWKNKGDMDNAFLGGVGLGYRLNDIVRVDGTVEYRAKNTTTARDRDFDTTRKYEGDVASTVLMANAYVDLVTYHNVTPYIGAGLGASANRVSNFEVDTSRQNYQTASNTEWDLAFAVHAGVGIKLSRRVIFDIGYSYSDLGDAKTQDISGSGSLKLDHLTSHDVKVGIRYAFN